MRRSGLIAIAVGSACARDRGVRRRATGVARCAAAAAAAASCKTGVSIGMLAPITGPAGSIGGDQLHWAQFYFTQWNKMQEAT